MLRKLSLALTVLVMVAFTASADTIPGTVKSIDTDKNTITITVDGKDQTFNVDPAGKVWQPGRTIVKDCICSPR